MNGYWVKISDELPPENEMVFVIGIAIFCRMKRCGHSWLTPATNQIIDMNPEYWLKEIQLFG